MTSTPVPGSESAIQSLPRVEIEFNQVVLPLLRALEEAGVPCWLDSGTLLGICRDGRPPSWDKDFDLAIWKDDFERCLHTVLSLLTQPEFQYYKLVRKDLKGAPYALILAQGGKVATRYRRIPIAFHIYERSGNLAVSPQPHYLGALGCSYARHVLSQSYPALLDVDGYTIRFDPLRFLSALLNSSTRRFLLCLISQKSSIPRRFSRLQRKLVQGASASFPMLPDAIRCASAYLDSLTNPRQSASLSLVLHDYAVNCKSLKAKSIARLSRFAEYQEIPLWDVIGDPFQLTQAVYRRHERQALSHFRDWLTKLIEQSQDLQSDCISLLNLIFSASPCLASLDTNDIQFARKRLYKRLSDSESTVIQNTSPTEFLAHVLRSEAEVASCYRVYSKHLCEYRLPLMNYELFEWRIPFDCFHKLTPAPASESCVLIPLDYDRYLTLRYGNWRVPAMNWVYVLQDGCITPMTSPSM